MLSIFTEYNFEDVAEAYNTVNYITRLVYFDAPLLEMQGIVNTDFYN